MSQSFASSPLPSNAKVDGQTLNGEQQAVLGGLKPFKRLISHDYFYILLLFAISRLALTIIGVSSRVALAQLEKPCGLPTYTNIPWIDIWGVWDTGWYLDIIRNWYYLPATPDPSVVSQANVVFFPLYPFLVRACSAVVWNQHFICGVIVSNLFLLAASFYVYKLARLDGDGKYGRSAVRYLYLFPTAFVLSGVFSESTYLALALMCFYYARRDRWWIVGLLGFCLALSRPPGVFIAAPLFFEYLKSRRFSLRRLDCRVLWLLLIPAGLGVFMYYLWGLTGDPLIFSNRQVAWGRYEWQNPLLRLWRNLDNPDFAWRFAAFYALVTLTVLFASFRALRFSYWLFASYTLLIPLSTGIYSMPRYWVVIFPLFLLFARWAQNDRIDRLLMLFLAMLQGFLMVFWTNGQWLMM